MIIFTKASLFYILIIISYMSGFFGSTSKSSCINDVFYGTDYHSHLGTKRAGMVFYCQENGFRRSIHNLENGYFRNKFEADLHTFSGNQGLGVISDTDPQPMLFSSHLGRFAIATVSRICNIGELENYFLDKRVHFTENFNGNVNPTEVVGNLINEKENFIAGIENVYNNVKGSCSMLILTPEGIIAARDKLGRTPVIIGKKDNAWAVATETAAFPNTGFETEYYLGPGEIVMITADGYTRLREPGKKMQVCSFLWVYYGYPPSYYEGINVEESRYRCGAAIARRDNIEADFVCGVPDSGVGHAVGYSEESKLPYKRAYAKYTPTWPRSFMPQNQDQRDLVARMKLIPNKAIIEGKRIVCLDDSIVRGTQLKDNTADLRKAGAAAIHMRIACPPLLYPCDFLNFSQSRSTLELAGRRAVSELGGTEADLAEYANPDSTKYQAMVNKVAERLDLDTLVYQRLDDLVYAIGLPKDRLCTHCWDGTSYF